MLSTRILLLTFSFLLAGTAQASLIATLTPFTGDFVEVEVLAEQDGDDIKFTVAVIPPPTGDLRGAFFHIADETLLPGLSVVGVDVTDTLFGPADSVTNLGGGSILNGGGSPCGCDFAVEIGTSGMAPDDIQTTMFTLSHATESLALSLFANQEVGVRVTSVGFVGQTRTGSSKLGGSFGVVPEPSTAMLLGMGLLGLTRRRRS